ncbi:putative phage tail protein [Cohnella cholangitidis]|uniref:DUF2313 domain-containing protein n=1 Tax=Cohnella cholangitidis TaxID=2598458 RepID=A0A7G5C3G6_9BACL|nr:putative phage tail protein [Cohnella cholangitidis]QMV43750.1 DUF2313 domain-containing protein [Cohnella cholangitidis]
MFDVTLLPVFMRKSLIYKTIFESEAAQFLIAGNNLDDLGDQLSIDSATWALAIYEKEFGVVPEAGKPLNDRRSVIKSRMRGTGKVGAELIKDVADSFSNGDVTVGFDGGVITITFVSVVGIPPNLDDLKEAIEDVKPAHLHVTYVFNYTLWDEIDALNKTWDQWDDLSLTWDQMEVYT